MQFLQTFAGLFANFGNLTWQMVVMWVIGGLLIYLAIAKKMEPSLLLPMGFGDIPRVLHSNPQYQSEQPCLLLNGL